MARLFTSGFEARDSLVGGTLGLIDVNNQFSASGFSAETTVVRSGSASAKLDSGAGNTAPLIGYQFTGVLGRSYFVRACVRLPAFPTAQTAVLEIRTTAGVNLVSIRVSTAGVVSLWNESGTPAQIGSNGPTLLVDTWYRLELSVNVASGSGDDSAEAMVEGVSFASATAQTIGTVAVGQIFLGWKTAPGANKVIYFDDFAVNDDQGSSQTSWPTEGKVVMLLPISDNARDTLWTGGSGGTTNLFDAINNTPPTGTATETNSTQIEHAGGAAGTTDRYDANMTTPATAGIGVYDTITLAQFVEVDGEDVSTGTKLLNFEVLSNPVIASPGNVTAGADNGALGTYPATWAVNRSAVVYNPSLANGTSPVMRARRPETASRVASVCFMGIIVEYVPVPPIIVMAPLAHP